MKLISRQQQGIIRRIAKEQEDSFIRIARNEQVKKMIKEMRAEGYDVSETEVLESIMVELDNWMKVKDDPANFINVLDEVNLSMVRHHLINDYPESEDGRPIHRLLNLKEGLNKQIN